MTLVVARANPLGARIISDSRINDPCEVKQRPLEGALKSVVVNQLQCVAFGGVLAFAQDAVESLFANRLHERGDDEIILAHLLDAHRGSSSATGRAGTGGRARAVPAHRW